MSISGLRKASWYNPDTGTVVQANDLAEDGEFYTRAIEDPDDQTSTGESPYAGDESYCELMVFDMSLLPQLKAWQENDTRISMVAAGVQQNIQWYERDLVNVKPVYPVAAGRRNHINVIMQREGHGAHDIHGNVNLLSHLGTTADPWTDADGNGFPDGWENRYSPWDNTFFGSDTFEGHAPTNGAKTAVNINLTFPVAGVSVTLSSKITKIHDDGLQRLRILDKDYSGSNLSIHDNNLSSTGPKTIGIETGDNSYSMIVHPLMVQDATAQNTKAGVKEPSLRVDGSDKFVSY